MAKQITLFSFLLLYFYGKTFAFTSPVVPIPRSGWGLKKSKLSSQLDVSKEAELISTSDDESMERTMVRAPLKFIGPYPAMGLRFPKLATSSQRQRNISGVALDFVLDTAANTNTLNAQVASELQLPVVGQALPGVGSAGALMGGETYLLGDAELDGVPENFTFMTNLTASALPVASPAAAGLLSLAFLQSFPAVDFHWGRKSVAEEDQEPPSITFMDDLPHKMLEGRVRVPIKRIPITQLPSITVTVKGIEMPALLDTGSPVTVLNAQAAKHAGIETIIDSDEPKNPIAAMKHKIELANAATRGDVLSIFGAGGGRVNLIKSKEPVSVKVAGADPGNTIDFGSGNLFVGDLPGLAALNGLGVDSPPAVVLGMDVLTRRPNMLLRAQVNEVWF